MDQRQLDHVMTQAMAACAARISKDARLAWFCNAIDLQVTRLIDLVYGGLQFGYVDQTTHDLFEDILSSHYRIIVTLIEHAHRMHWRFCLSCLKTVPCDCPARLAFEGLN
jgi:hypothetical protein